MSDETAENRPDVSENAAVHEIRELARSMQRRLQSLAIAVIILAMVVTMLAAAVLGEMVNYFAGDTILFGAMALLGLVIGFPAGWVVGRIGRRK